MPQLQKEYRGKGWWGESIRHSIAKRFGCVNNPNPATVTTLSREERIKKARKDFSRTVAGRKKLFRPPPEYIEFDETPQWYRFRLRDPDDFQKGSFRIIPRKGGRVHIVVGRLKGQKTTTAQSIRYKKIS